MLPGFGIHYLAICLLCLVLLISGLSVFFAGISRTILSSVPNRLPSDELRVKSLHADARSISHQTEAPALPNQSSTSKASVLGRFPLVGKRTTLSHSYADISKMAWVHFPKTGTSIMNAFLTAGCPTMPSNESVSDAGGGGSGHVLFSALASKFHSSCYPGFTLCENHNPISLEMQACPWCGPTDPTLTGNPTKVVRGCRNWNLHRGNFVTLFRQPEQRITSSYEHGRHDCRNFKGNISEYGQRVAGCYANMLTGHRCDCRDPANASRVSLAIERLRTGFVFVGLVEEWSLSVCLFHALFGSRCSSRDFLNFRPGKGTKQKMRACGDGPRDPHSGKCFNSSYRHSTEALQGWTDPYDGPVYAEAVAIFWERVAAMGVDAETCRTVICPGFSHLF
ncbi:unnamed protein product [Prorocentrum cordatum]|uniref:Uncharacterized protein n=1 Tax=Prorocentrum cordatum TaxID=2364126 RepID=A0ABN9TJZ5_9DINO|nr:unnamed protein product [Polarella glacialis]